MCVCVCVCFFLFAWFLLGWSRQAHRQHHASSVVRVVLESRFLNLGAKDVEKALAKARAALDGRPRKRFKVENRLLVLDQGQPSSYSWIPDGVPCYQAMACVRRGASLEVRG